MPMLVRYLTHPQVQIEPAHPMSSWGLNAVGRARVKALVEAGWLRGTTHIIASAEQKALETAEPIAAALGIRFKVRGTMHENDRSATGFLPPDEFERVASQFFAHPDDSIRGWEKARDAQSRIVREVEIVLAQMDAGHILFVGHGAVGTLLMCHYADVQISRAYDQPLGGGHYFTLAKATRKLVHTWRRMEDAP